MARKNALSTGPMIQPGPPPGQAADLGRRRLGSGPTGKPRTWFCSLGLSGHRDPRRTHTASARRATLAAVLNVVQWMGAQGRPMTAGLGVGPQGAFLNLN